MADPVEVDLSYSIVWSLDDEEWAASCSRFPSVSWLAPTPLEALAGLEALMLGFAEASG